MQICLDTLNCIDIIETISILSANLLLKKLDKCNYEKDLQTYVAAGDDCDHSNGTKTT